MRMHSIANVIAVLNAACGDDAAHVLVRTYGGKRIDVPLNVTGKLVDDLGPDITAALVAHFGGCKLDVPSWGHAERIGRSLRLRHDILTTSLNANELAARHGVTSMWVRKLRAQLCAPASSHPEPRKYRQ